MNADRIYQGEDDRWYFNVRGNLAKGPFASYREAEEALDKHVRQCRRPLGSVTWPKTIKALATGRRRVSEPRHP